MLNTLNPDNFSSHILMDERNKRLVINGYTRGLKPSLFSRQLIDFAVKKKLEKIWLWTFPTDVPEFLKAGFCTEGHIFRGNGKEFSVSLAYYVSKVRGQSNKLQAENDLIHAVRTEPTRQLQALPHGMELKLLNESFAEQISQVLTRVFTSYPTSMYPQYIASLIQNGNIFAGAFLQERLIAVSAAYPDPVFNRCEMTDCATIEEYRGHSLTERLLVILEQEVQKLGSFNIYTLARARSFGINRVFHKLGYRYQGRLINNCHIAGSFEDMNLWVR
ncbi:putative beta-lysine N-acetyltransferase [Desulfosporosinus youngiae]|uniref:Putative beta-lysine N-acetyltransferase n=1 Tax=Desulfosporosinus youngiae DSM 17734 TaxID=768710 RepID=H5XXT9_9FIRM|nr:putative beta-lysine N-acetyltransferase [Desulfosporosinus youngiae]EHQ91368.1 putative beta-lysine N-acetyltransferase [Desulfosporosinus youngiae DSM 17734]